MAIQTLLPLTYNTERPRLLKRVFLNNTFFADDFTVATETDISAVTAYKSKLYILGNGNKKLYVIDSETLKPLAVKDIPTAADTTVTNLVGIAVTNTFQGERIFVLMEVSFFGTAKMMLLELTLDLETSLFFYVNNETYLYPLYKNGTETLGFGRGMATDGNTLYVHGGKNAEVIYRLSNRGAMLGVYTRGAFLGNATSIIAFSSPAFIGLTYGYDSSIDLVDQEITQGTSVFRNETEFKTALLRTVIKQGSIPSSAGIEDITLIWKDQTNGSTGKTYKTASAFTYSGKQPDYTGASGIEFVNGFPMIGRKYLSTSTDALINASKNGLYKYSNKMFDTGRVPIIKGVEPFSSGEYNSFSGDIAFDGSKFWAVNRGSLYQYEYIYHCFKVNSLYVNDIDLEVVRKGTEKIQEVVFENVSNNLDLEDVTITVKDLAEFTDDDYITISADGTEYSKSIDLGEIEFEGSKTFYIKCDIPSSADLSYYDNKVAFLDVNYTAC